MNVICETLSHPYTHIKSFVRRLRMKFLSPIAEQFIPISINILDITVPVSLESRP